MKIMIASDIHGDSNCTEKMLEIFDSEHCEKLLLLGDILYHGPRNDLPSGYSPKRVIELLNARANNIIALKGNCDAEVDEMVLKFKITPAFLPLEVNGLRIVATHGHRYNKDNLPELDFDILLYGHTHIQRIEKSDSGKAFINPGSVSIPKENNPCTIAILDKNALTIYDFEMKPVNSIKFI